MLDARQLRVFIFTKKNSFKKANGIYGQNSNFLSFHTKRSPCLIFALALALLMLVAVHLQTR